MPDEEKRQYFDLYEKDKQRYQEEILSYDAKNKWMLSNGRHIY